MPDAICVNEYGEGRLLTCIIITVAIAVAVGASPTTSEVRRYVSVRHWSDLIRTIPGELFFIQIDCRER